MLKNYLKIALRNIYKYRGYSFINIFGLAVGMACSFLVLIYIYDELSYDRFHEKADRLYRIVRLLQKRLLNGILGTKIRWEKLSELAAEIIR